MTKRFDNGIFKVQDRFRESKNAIEQIKIMQEYYKEIYKIIDDN